MIQRLIPCLHFDGDAKEAIDMYAEIFNITDVLIMTYESMLKGGFVSYDENLKDKIAHAEFDIGGHKISVDDVSLAMGNGYVRGNSFSILLSFDDEVHMRKVFDDVVALGGRVEEALNPSPWGSLYGIVSDRFGVNWELDADLK